MILYIYILAILYELWMSQIKANISKDYTRNDLCNFLLQNHSDSSYYNIFGLIFLQGIMV